jgi:hypothetical protein
MLPDKAFKPTGFGSSARMTLEGGGGLPFSPEFIQNLLHPGQSQQAAEDWVKMMRGTTQSPAQTSSYQPQAYEVRTTPTPQQPWWMQQGAGATANAMQQQQQPQTQSTQIPSWANQQGAGATANAYQNYMQQLQQPQAGLGALVPQPPYK